jgi:O-antigen ligase
MKPNRWATMLDNQVVAIVLALVLLVPLVFAGPNETAGPLVAYGFLGLLLFTAWLARAQKSLSLESLRSRALAGPNLPILLFLGWSLFSTVTSREPFYSRIAFLQLAFGGLIYAMVTYQFRTRGHMKALIGSLLTTAMLLVLGAFAFDAERRFTNLAGAFQNRQLFAAFLGLLLPVLLGVAAGTRQRSWKIAAHCGSILALAALLLTQCRSAWFGLAISLLVFGGLSLLYVWKWEAIQKKKHELFLAPLVAVVVLGGLLATTQLAGPLQWRAGTVQRLGEDRTFQTRLQMWNVAERMIAARPVTGWGIGNYAFAQQPFNPKSHSVDHIRRFGPSLSENPHNFYLQVGAELGLVGLGLFLAVLGLFFYRGIRALPKLRRGLRQYALIGCMAAVAGMCVDAIANPSWVLPQVSLFFWLVLGVGMCAAGLGEESAEQVSREERAATDRVTGIPQPVYRMLRGAMVGATVLALGSQILGIGLMSEASASHPPEFDYRAELTGLRIEYLDDVTPVPAGFGVTQATIQLGAPGQTSARFRIYGLISSSPGYVNFTGDTPEAALRVVGDGMVTLDGNKGAPFYRVTPVDSDSRQTLLVQASYWYTDPSTSQRAIKNAPQFRLVVNPKSQTDSAGNGGGGNGGDGAGSSPEDGDGASGRSGSSAFEWLFDGVRWLLGLQR